MKKYIIWLKSNSSLGYDKGSILHLKIYQFEYETFFNSSLIYKNCICLDDDLLLKSVHDNLWLNKMNIIIYKSSLLEIW